MTIPDARLKELLLVVIGELRRLAARGGATQAQVHFDRRSALCLVGALAFVILAFVSDRWSESAATATRATALVAAGVLIHSLATDQRRYLTRDSLPRIRAEWARLDATPEERRALGELLATPAPLDAAPPALVVSLIQGLRASGDLPS